MGLSTSHGCWSAPYSMFNEWRAEIAKAAGFPPLCLMDGFSRLRRSFALPPTLEEQLPIKWEAIAPSPLTVLLSHSDCEGEIAIGDCKPLADALEALTPAIDHHWHHETWQFIEGLRDASAKGEAVDFH